MSHRTIGLLMQLGVDDEPRLIVRLWRRLLALFER
jgi:hypothetical protein